MDHLILIPARAGSTRVQNKNLRLLGGKPLLAHCVEAAARVANARVIVSTNSKEIAEVARAAGADIPFMRPDNLCQATSSSLSAVLHALLWLREHERWTPHLVAICPPTNPFITTETIEGMIKQLTSRPDRNSTVTVTQPKTHPFRIVARAADGTIKNGLIELEGKNINDIERSQDWPVVWEGSPACRMSRASYFLSLPDCTNLQALSGKTYDVSSALGYEIPAYEAFDIDNEEDLLVAEALLKAKSSAA